MRILRFIDENKQIRYGYNYNNGLATILEGDLFTGLKDTGEKAGVMKWLAPVVPSAILCIGLNYHDHAKETGSKIPRYPILFMKNPASLTNPGDPIVIPQSCMDPMEVDYEIELAVIIGKSTKNVPAEKALDYIFGYTVANDVSARRWQKNAGGGQWIRGKSFDTFCPLGPALVTSDTINDPQNLALETIVNGKIMQKTNTSDMIFSVAEIIEYLSSGMTLLPGTVILTGTPSGVGFVQKPPAYLKPGDMVEMTIEQIGTLTNRVIC